MNASHHGALTPGELEADTWSSWWLAHTVIGEMVRAGEALHPLHQRLFVPASERGDAV